MQLSTIQFLGIRRGSVSEHVVRQITVTAVEYTSLNVNKATTVHLSHILDGQTSVPGENPWFIN